MRRLITMMVLAAGLTTATAQTAYRTATNLVKQLVDIVSKNGNLLLNIPLRAGSTYDEKAVFFTIGRRHS